MDSDNGSGIYLSFLFFFFFFALGEYMQDVVRIYQVVIRLPALVTCLEAQEPEDENKAKLLVNTYTSNIEVNIYKKNVVHNYCLDK